MTPRKVHVNDVDLHTIEQGAGDALVLVHGGLGDYRSWVNQLEAFSQHYRVLSYSRRYSYPNENLLIAPDYSVFAEVDDLGALVDRLQLCRVHLVGHSYGAFIALILALKRPRMVHTLVIAEPPLHRLAKEILGGDALFDQLMSTVWDPVKNAFVRGDTLDAIRIFTNGIGGMGYFESLPAVVRAARLQNAQALHALALSSDPFPALSWQELQRITVPTLIVEGEKTIRLHQLVDETLLRWIPNCGRVIIADAAHGTPHDNPDEFNKAVLGFLGGCG